VGDTVSRDVIGSKQAGFAAAIQICSRLTREKDLKLEKAPEADYMIEDIFDTARVVRELLKKTV
jgi:ribonucleotide monophosphatase NagD (HAD superfamily)